MRLDLSSQSKLLYPSSISMTTVNNKKKAPGENKSLMFSQPPHRSLPQASDSRSLYGMNDDNSFTTTITSHYLSGNRDQLSRSKPLSVSVSEVEDDKTKAWYSNPNNLRNCVYIAENLNNRFQNAQIYSLGQSPAWIVRTIGFFRENTAQQNSTHYIPFSGRTFEAKQKLFHPEGKYYTTTYKRIQPINQKAEEQYRAELTKIGLSPKEIVANGKNIVLLEYTQTGESLASFLAILFSWAKEEGCFDEFNRLFRVVLLQQYFCNLKTLVFDNMACRCEKQSVPTEMIVPMANGSHSGEFCDRLVPHHPYWEFENSLTPLTNQATIAKVDQLIRPLVHRIKSRSSLSKL
jgi:hypothetical protein